jgi:hypothetical protein
LDLDGSARCLRCGLDQAFATSAWKRAIGHAHAVGDLAGSPEGRHPHPVFSIAKENPYANTTGGRDSQSGFVTERGVQIPTNVQVNAEVGTPDCEKCRVPLVVQRRGPGEIHSTCPRCGEARTYVMPAEGPRLSPGLVGVMATEHRTDTPMTRVEDRPGAIAILCPSCGGGLEVNRDSRFATCTYCRTTSRIPEKTLYRSGSDVVKPERFWLAFEGPSAMRKKLERDPSVPIESSTQQTDLKVQVPPKRKKMPPTELALVVLIPLFFVLIVGIVDQVILEGLELDPSAFGLSL